jgi:hypothetical protein
MWSLCGGRDKESGEPGAASGEEPIIGDETYRPGRGLAREMIDEQAMAPSAQVEVPAGTPRSNFSVRNSAGYRPPGGASAGGEGSGATLSAFSSANATGFRGGSAASGSEGGDAQGEILGEELKKEGNQLYNEGQLEAAELVYSEALKVRDLARAHAWARAPRRRRNACSRIRRLWGLARREHACMHARARCAARARAARTRRAARREHAACVRACGATPRRAFGAAPRGGQCRVMLSVVVTMRSAAAAAHARAAPPPSARSTHRKTTSSTPTAPCATASWAASWCAPGRGRCCARAHAPASRHPARWAGPCAYVRALRGAGRARAACPPPRAAAAWHRRAGAGWAQSPQRHPTTRSHTRARARAHTHRRPHSFPPSFFPQIPPLLRTR